MRETATPLRKRPRWQRLAVWFCAPAAVAIGLFLARGQILAAWGQMLVAHPQDEAIDTLVLWEADRELDAAVWLCAARDKAEGRSQPRPAGLARLASRRPVQRLLVVQWAPGRLEQMEIMPSKTDLIVAALERDGVPAAHIEPVSDAYAANNWDAARQIAAWLAEHPKARVGVLRNALGSRLVEAILREVTPEADRNRCTVIPVQPTDYAVDRWWAKEAGMLDVFFGSIGLVFHWVAHEPQKTQWQWQPAEWLPNAHAAE